MDTDREMAEMAAAADGQGETAVIKKSRFLMVLVMKSMKFDYF